ncbi:MAG TPA: sulfurtransferase [Vicinamibacterales bacterium]|nr:sulfurtransferase [Vicinamibacterales bacterium]
MRINRLVSALGCVAMLSLPALAQEPSSLLVDIDWLSQHVNDRGLVILHVGNRQEYDAGHIPGARFITEEDVAAPHDHSNPKDMMLELPPVDALRAKVASFGISDDSRIVVYFGKNGGVPSATRIVFTLDYLGLGDRTSLLNGGLAAWQRAGKTVTAAAPPVVAGKLSARPPKSLVVDAEFVKSVRQRPNHTLVDARAAVFYQGIQPTMNNVSGHIPGAVNIPFTEITDTELRIDRARIEGLFRKAGVKPGDTVVAYCHVGQQATAVVFAARLLGHPVVMYDGAFQDWAVNNRGPVEK